MKKILILFTFPLLLSGCVETKTRSYDYEDISNLTISWSEIFDISMTHYFVYIYSKTCGHCQKIKQDVLSYAMSHDDLYFVVYDKTIPIVEDVNNTIGKTNYEDIGIKGTPTLLEIFEHELISNIAGTTAIIETLTNLY